VLDQEIVDIQDLDGVGPVAAGKLREAGFDSILAIAVPPIRELVDKLSCKERFGSGQPKFPGDPSRNFGLFKSGAKGHYVN